MWRLFTLANYSLFLCSNGRHKVAAGSREHLACLLPVCHRHSDQRRRVSRTNRCNTATAKPTHRAPLQNRALHSRCSCAALRGITPIFSGPQKQQTIGTNFALTPLLCGTEIIAQSFAAKIKSKH